MPTISDVVSKLQPAEKTPPTVINGKKQLNPDDFITLFTNQLTHQNPFKPADSSTLLQQMADISTITASKDTQKALANLQQDIEQALGNSQFLNSSQLIGKRVEVSSGNSQLVANEGLYGSIVLPGAADNVKVTIKDQNNNVVKEILLDATSSAGTVDFNWDGKKADSTTASPDFYQISATAVVDGKEVKVPTLGAFKVKSVAANPQTRDVALNVEGLGGLDLKNIIKII